MKELDCVEVIAEKEKYAKEGIHKGMQGWICDPRCIHEHWLVNFPQCGEKDDIATSDIKEEDLLLLPNGMDAKVNEKIKAQFDALKEEAKSTTESTEKKAENLSDHCI